jgi:hypothetical protein
MAQLSPALERYLQTAKPDDLVDLVLELRDTPAPEALPADRGLRATKLDELFTAATAPLAQLVETAGGTLLGSSWLSSALKVRMPVKEIASLHAIDRVELIDLPRKITR